jgi:hypothetical protein
MAASDRLIRWLCWALIVASIAAAILSATTAVNPFSTNVPDGTDLVDRLLTYRRWDQQLYPIALVSNVTAIAVLFLGTLIGVALRALAAPGVARDMMTAVFVIGGVVGVVSQLVNLGVNHAATFTYCDCGYRAYEVIAHDYGLAIGWNIQQWLNVASLAILGIGVAIAGRIVPINRDWSTVSYLIAIGLAIGVVLQLAGQGQTAQIMVGVTAGIGVSVWAFLLARAMRDGAVADAGAAAEPTATT